MWETIAKILKIVFRFGNIHSMIYNMRRNKNDKIMIRAGQRVMKYGERIRNAMGVNVLKECLREEEGEAT